MMPRMPAPNDNDLALRVFDDLSASRAAPVYAEGQFWEFVSGTGLWRALPDEHLLQMIQGYHKDEGRKVAGETIAIGVAMRDAAFRLLRTKLFEPAFFDNAPPGIALIDCFLSFTTEAPGYVAVPLDEHCRARHLLDIRATDLHSQVEPVLFLRFLSQIFADDSDAAAKIELVAQFIGIALLGCASRFEKVLVPVGEGANGKSVFLAIVEGLFPKDSICSLQPQTLSDEKRVAMLAGKKLNCVHETPAKAIVDTANLKSIVSGQAVTGRRMRHDPFSFIPTAAHIFAANKLPDTNDTSGALWRRFMPLGFNRVFGEHERQFPHQIITPILGTERMAVIRWAVGAGLRALAQGSFSVPASSIALTAQWKATKDPAKEFFESQCVIAPPTIRASMMQDVFNRWCSDQRLLGASNRAVRRAALLLGMGVHRKSDANYYKCIFKEGSAALQIWRDLLAERKEHLTVVPSVADFALALDLDDEAEDETA